MNYIYNIKSLKSKREEIFNLLNQLTDAPLISQKNFNMIIDNLNDKHKIFVYYQDNKVKGILTYFIEQKLIHNGSSVAHIEDLVVDVNYKGQGIASKLLDFCLEEIKKTNCYKIILNCKTELITFYERFDFQIKNAQMSLYLE